MVWTRQFGTAGSDVAEGLTISSDSSIYISGHTNGDLDGVSAGAVAILFVAKLDANGTALWVRQPRNCQRMTYSAYGIRRGDANGIVYVVGGTEGNLDGRLDQRQAAVKSALSSGTTRTGTGKVGTQLVCEEHAQYPPAIRHASEPAAKCS